ncbi:MAG: Swarming motility protein ybiA [Chthoniobacteraceae bacterium]|nr:Swarming motility protein ybiA [Chthoniobacteraceae bacterium]
MNWIYFYDAVGPYGNLSNSSPHPLLLEGRFWVTVEHYFQAQKFTDPQHQETIRNAVSPVSAGRLARKLADAVRADWEEVMEKVMREGLMAKFTQHHDLRRFLLSTGTLMLIAHTESDWYWGDGGDGSGLNRLGFMLMEVRESLKSESALNVFQ